MNLVFAIAIGAMFAIGIYQILRRNILRCAIGLVILGNAINLFLLTAGAYNGLVPSYSDAVAQRADAIPQALILTAIVISMGGFSFVLSLILVIAMRRKTADTDDLTQLKH
jgi:multicomponent Na+:H+ antiporter subunit C